MPGPSSLTRRLFPVLIWLPAYQRDWLMPDILAGLVLWAVMVPEAMAYAGIVGVPLIMGLYTTIPPLIAYALMGSSRQLVVGPDTPVAVIARQQKSKNFYRRGRKERRGIRLGF